MRFSIDDTTRIRKSVLQCVAVSCSVLRVDALKNELLCDFQ